MGTGRLIEPGWQLARDESSTASPGQRDRAPQRARQGWQPLLAVARHRHGQARRSHEPLPPVPDGDEFPPILVSSKGAVAAFGHAEGLRFWDLAGPVGSAAVPGLGGRSCRSSSAAARNPWPSCFHPAPQFSQDIPGWSSGTSPPASRAPFPVRLAAGSDEQVSLDGRIFATVAGRSIVALVGPGHGPADRPGSCRVKGATPLPVARCQTLFTLTRRPHRLFALDTGLHARQPGAPRSRFYWGAHSVDEPIC